MDSRLRYADNRRQSIGNYRQCSDDYLINIDAHRQITDRHWHLMTVTGCFPTVAIGKSILTYISLTVSITQYFTVRHPLTTIRKTLLTAGTAATAIGNTRIVVSVTTTTVDKSKTVMRNAPMIVGKSGTIVYNLPMIIFF